jgi:hypothetical protein
MRQAGPGEVLERRYRRLLACYPSAYRAAYGEEMLAVAMAAAGPGRRWPDPGEAADLIVSGLRRRLGSVREAGREPAWRDAAAAVAVIGPVLMAAFAARHLLTPVSGIHGWQYFGPVPAGGITVAVAWAAVAVAAVLGWRRLALAGCSALLIGLTCDFALAAGGNPYAWGASWWEVVFAAVIAASALLAVKSEHRLVTWPALTAIAMAAMLLAALPAITAATLTPPLSPGDTMNAAFKAWASNVITMMNIQAWLNDAVPAGLALVLLVVIARLRPAVTRACSAVTGAGCACRGRSARSGRSTSRNWGRGDKAAAVALKMGALPRPPLAARRTLSATSSARAGAVVARSRNARNPGKPCLCQNGPVCERGGGTGRSRRQSRPPGPRTIGSPAGAPD